MDLKLVGVHLKNSQLKYIVAVQARLLQEKFNFNFEYFDEESDFAQIHGVKFFPSFLFFKNNKLVEHLEGKVTFEELKEKLMKISYVKQCE